MSIGEEITPLLPYLRRFSHALAGTQTFGDSFVRATLETIIAYPDSINSDTDTRLALYRFHLNKIDELSKNFDSFKKEKFNSIDWNRALDKSYQALLLKSIENFTISNVAYVLDVSVVEARKLIEKGILDFQSIMTASILIVEDEPMIAMDLSTIVEDSGHNVVAIANTRSQAVDYARNFAPDLILMDIALSDGSSGIDAVHDIKSFSKVPVIFITAFPERLLTSERPEPTFLITKPFQRATVKTAIAQALLQDAVGITPAAEPLEENVDIEDGSTTVGAATSAAQDTENFNAAVVELAGANLTQMQSPIQATVTDRQLRMVLSGHPIGVAGQQGTDGLRRMHFATAARLCSGAEASNLGIPFAVRITAVRDALHETLDDTRALQLGVQVEGLRDMIPTIREQLTDQTAADIERFITDCGNLAWSFEIYRQFVGSARGGERLSKESREALVEVSKIIESQSDNEIEPDLRTAMAAARINAQAGDNVVADLGMQRVLGNVWRAYAEYIQKRFEGTFDSFNKTFDKAVGGVAGSIVAVLLIIAPLLAGVSAIFPSTFPYVVEIGKIVKLLIP